MESKVSNRRLVNIGYEVKVANATTPMEFQANFNLDFTPDEVIVRNAVIVRDVTAAGVGLYVLRSSLVDNRDLCVLSNAMNSNPQVRHNLRQPLRGNYFFKVYDINGSPTLFPNGNNSFLAVSLEFIKY